MNRKTKVWRGGSKDFISPANHKPKNVGRFRRFLLRIMGPALAKKAIHAILRKKIDTSPAAIPSDLGRCSDILFILPTDRVEMIYQLENIFSILAKYRGSTLTFVSPAGSSPYVSGLKNVHVIKYDPEKFLIYSLEFNRVIRELATKSFDICIMLEKQYTLAHLYILGISRAHLRIGWENGNCFPFLNIRLVPILRDNVTLWERNSEAAKFMHAPINQNMRWGVQKTTAGEVAQLLNEHKLKKDPALICVDLTSLENNCGKDWCAQLLKSLKNSNAGNFYIFGGSEGDGNSFKDLPVSFPILPAMSVPRVAALIACTDLVITSAGALLGLAQISAAKIIPVVTDEQAAMYCKQNNRISPVIITREKSGNDETVRAVLKNIKTLINE